MVGVPDWVDPGASVGMWAVGVRAACIRASIVARKPVNEPDTASWTDWSNIVLKPDTPRRSDNEWVVVLVGVEDVPGNLDSLLRPLVEAMSMERIYILKV